MIEAILKSKELNEAVVFKQLFSQIPSWEDFMQSMFIQTKKQPERPEDKRFDIVGKVKFWSPLVSEISNIDECIDIKSPIDILKKSHPFEMHEAKGVVSFSTSGYYSYHLDLTDNFFWQCNGSAVWNVDGKQYTMEPGDVIFNPAKNPHMVEPICARNAIVFSFISNPNNLRGI